MRLNRETSEYFEMKTVIKRDDNLRTQLFKLYKDEMHKIFKRRTHRATWDIGGKIDFGRAIAICR